MIKDRIKGSTIKNTVSKFSSKIKDIQNIINGRIDYRKSIKNDIEKMDKKLDFYLQYIKNKHQVTQEYWKSKKNQTKNNQHKNNKPKKNKPQSIMKTRKLLPNISKNKYDLNKTYNFIKQLSFTNKLKTFKGYRIFFIDVHGISTQKKNISKGVRRLDYYKLLKPYNKDKKSLTIITPQSFGRLSYDLISSVITDKSESKYFLPLHSGLINMKTEEEVKIMNYYTTSLYLNLNYSTNEKLPKIIFLENTFPGDKKSISKEVLTEYMKYNYKNPCENNFLHIGETKTPDFLGIYEIKINNKIKELKTAQTKELDNKLKKKIKKKNSKYGIKYLLCLDFMLNENKNKFNDVLKYNKEFIKKYGIKKYYYFYLEDIINIIYDKGNIKDNEKVVIISNHCRGVETKKEDISTGDKLRVLSDNNSNKKKGLKRRRTSKTKMWKSIYPSNLK